MQNRLKLAIRLIIQQIDQIQQGVGTMLSRKLGSLARKFTFLFLCLTAIPFVIMIRLIRPWLLVRICGMQSSRIGHFAAEPELYLCERDAGINKPKQRHLDLFFFKYRPICNYQLASMWKRVLNIWPAWILYPVATVNQLIPGGLIHDIINTQRDRDIHNLYDRFPSNINFTDEEEAKGETELRVIGIAPAARFVCLIVRDSAYLKSQFKGSDFSYHNYRDCDIKNFLLVADELTKYGYFVVRMGAKVHKPLVSDNPRIIDYAYNGMRSDFMDIYLGAKCDFCISVGTGFDAIPTIFRKPIAYVNINPAGCLITFRKNVIGILKHHFFTPDNRELTLKEIFSNGLGYCSFNSDYESKRVQLIENTPEEIRDVAVEMVERLNGSWTSWEDDEILQETFWKIFPTDAMDIKRGKPMHGEIRSRFGASYLRNNREWLK